MAESISINFKEARWTDIVPALDSLCRSYEPGIWLFPKQNDWSLRVYPYDELLYEYEDDEIAKLETCLGGIPTSILCIELRRSHGDVTVDYAHSLVLALLRVFNGVVDDLLSECWTSGEIAAGTQKAGGRFLDLYRIAHKNQSQ
jgi:hypothetical protein